MTVKGVFKLLQEGMDAYEDEGGTFIDDGDVLTDASGAGERLFQIDGELFRVTIKKEC